MTSRHSRNDDYREPLGRQTTSRGSARDSRDITKRPRDEPRTSRKVVIPEESMDIDMEDDSDDYNRRRRERPEKYDTGLSRNPKISVTSNRHGRERDRSPPDEPGRTIINATSDRDIPRVKPGSDRDFWIPNEGIERDVITYEITRYLGQDALVRPGKNDKGRSGYLITAFRAPTTEMIRSMKEASAKYLREKESRIRPADYSKSRTATGRDEDLGRDRERERERERDREPQSRRRGGGYDSDDSMDDAPPVSRGYDRDYDRREPEPRRGDRHARDQRDIDLRQMGDPRYQDPRTQDPRIQDPRYQQQDPRMQDPRLQDPRIIPDPRYQDPRYQDVVRDIPVTSGRHQAYTSAYADPSIPGYTLTPSSQPPGFDYSMAQPRTGFSNNTPPPTTRGGPPVYAPQGYPNVSQAPQVMRDPSTGRLVQVPAGYDPPRNRHGR